MPANRVTVIGSSNIDLVCQLPRLPRPGETVGGGRFTQVPGGKGANQAVAAARAGADVTFVTRLGREANGRVMRDGLVGEGITLIPHEPDPESPTGTAMILVDERGENCIAVSAGANGNLSPGDLETAGEAIRAADVVLMQLEVPADTVCAALERAAQAGVFTILNYAPADDRAVPLGPAISLLIVNETEAAVLSGLARVDAGNAAEAIDRLRATGVGAVTLTIGEGGAVIGSDAFTGHVPGFRVDPVDTTGAGDTFCGALAARLAAGDGLGPAARYANAAAALSVRALGAQAAIPNREQVESYLRPIADS